MRQATAYLIKAGGQNVTPLRSLTEMADALARESAILETAIEIGRSSAANVVNPVLKEAVACASAISRSRTAGRNCACAKARLAQSRQL